MINKTKSISQVVSFLFPRNKTRLNWYIQLNTEIVYAISRVAYHINMLFTTFSIISPTLLLVLLGDRFLKGSFTRVKASHSLKASETPLMAEQ